MLFNVLVKYSKIYTIYTRTSNYIILDIRDLKLRKAIVLTPKLIVELCTIKISPVSLYAKDLAISCIPIVFIYSNLKFHNSYSQDIGIFAQLTCVV